jgi:hypothetical protein
MQLLLLETSAKLAAEAEAAAVGQLAVLFPLFLRFL